MKLIGAHVSASGGVDKAPERAKEIGAGGFAIFTKNQRRWDAKPLDESTITAFKKAMDEYGFAPQAVLPHDGYLINLGQPDTAKRKKSLNAFLDEAERVAALGLEYLNFHPGSHLGQISEEECLMIIADGINEVLDAVSGVTLVVETTAGMGNHVGYRFEHLAALRDLSTQPDRVGACIDTCHIFAAGYDIRTKEAYLETMEEFDSIVGLENLKGLHLNDSKGEIGGNLDRHASLGDGVLGWEPFQFFMEDSRIADIPCVLETPDTKRWAEEVKTLYSFLR
jgi:deoxyribonuclease IV